MSRSLNILRVIPFFEPASGFGGSVSQSVASSAELAARGHRISVLTSDLGIGEDLPRNRWIERRGYRVYYATATGRQTRPPYPPASSDQVMRGAMEEADLLCMNVGLTLLNRRAKQIASQQGLPYVYNAEGALCPHRLKQKRLAKLAFLSLVERGILRAASALQAVTEKEKGDLMQQGAEAGKIHVIPNAVQALVASRPDAGPSMRARLGIPEAAIILLFFGRLNAAKGVEFLFESCRELLQRRADLHLVFAGPDEGAGQGLQSRVQVCKLQGQVHLPGSLQGEDREAILAAANLFLLPSSSEGMPLAALEAAAAGLPLLLSPECNLSPVDETGAGRVLPLERESWTDGIASMLADPGHLQVCGDNARQMVQAQFSLAVTVDRLESLYRKVARR